MSNKFEKKHPIQKMMEEAKRGVAPREHDRKLENSLIIAFQNGEKQAGFELVKLYQDVFSVIINKPAGAPYNGGRMRKLWDGAPSYCDYEDMYQEILTQFLQMVKEFDTTGKAPFEHKVRKTLHQRFFNRYFSEFIEKRDLEKSYDDEINLEASSSLNKKTDEAPKKKPSDYPELYDALDKLSAKQRQVVELSVVKGWDSSFIAEELGMSNNTVRVHLKRGLDKLKTLMGAE